MTPVRITSDQAFFFNSRGKEKKRMPNTLTPQVVCPFFRIWKKLKVVKCMSNSQGGWGWKSLELTVQ